jgi:putative ABC transport system permease protein
MIEYIIKIKRKTRSIFQDKWVWKMAWRDGKHNFSRLFLFVASLITGIAALVAIGSLNYSMKEELNKNAKELLGADLQLKSNKEFDKEFIKSIDTVKRKVAYEADMASMVMFMNTRQSRLVKVTAMQGDFPFYGDLITQPANAYHQVQTGDYVMLDELLARQYEVSSEDSIKVGNRMFKVAGVVEKIPGGGGLTSTLAPAIYISMTALDSTGLVQFGSRVNYSLFIKTTTDRETENLLERIKPSLEKLGYSYDTVEESKRNLGEGFQSVYRFFSLLAFVALILGCIGVASSVHIYAREKREEVAVLRCVGSSGWQAFNIYFIQIFILGLIGSLAGVVIGVGIHQILPFAFKEYLPLELELGISWLAVMEGLLLGCIVTILFSILPLVAVRFVPPLSVLRADFNPETTFSKTRWLVIALIVLFPFLVATYQTTSILSGLTFTVGLLLALGGLTLVAVLLLRVLRKYFPRNGTFILRHALSNLFRPNNQTRVLVITIGLGAFIITTLNITQHSILNQVEFQGNENESNTILFDIQPSQKEGVVKLIEDHKLPLNQLVPIVTCRLTEVRGLSIETLQDSDSIRIPNWALRREYRVTYRDSLHHSEELIKGEIHSLTKGAKDSVKVTISEGMHETLKVDLGDSLVFDIQGVPVKAFISGIRKVDWPKDPPNFIFVFPQGVLEEAPQIWVAATRVEDIQKANRFQQELVMGYSNVSLIDLRLILNTVNQLFDKISVVIRFLALFSIITGLIVLAGAVLNSKFARMKENILLRTIGARSRQILNITLIEYSYVGIISAITGLLLSLGGGYLLTRFYFEIQFSVNWVETAYISAGVVFLTIFIGWFNSREVINTPPLQVLRKEN